MKEIQERSTQHWFEFKKSPTIAPGEGYGGYSFSFMGAVHNSKIYLEKILQSNFERTATQDEKLLLSETFPKTVSVDNCIRIDALKKSWTSHKHLINFQMLGISWYMSIEEGISLSYQLLQDQLGDSNCSLSCRVHPDDVRTIQTLEANSVPYTFSLSCEFNNPKTTRKGYRIEYVASFENEKGVKEERELLNLVKVNKLDNVLLEENCIFEWGGALERVQALQADIHNLFKLPKFQTIQAYVGNSPKLIDILSAIFAFKSSGYLFANNNQRNKTYRELRRELVYTMLEEGVVHSEDTLLLAFNHMQDQFDQTYALEEQPLERTREFDYLKKISKQYITLTTSLTPHLSVEEIWKVYKKVADGQIGLLNLALRNVWSNIVYTESQTPTT